jgi:hypothetical protein
VILRCGVGDHPATHAVTGEDDAPGIDSKGCNVGRIAEKREHRAGVLKVLRKAEVARAAPGSAVVERHGIPAGAPQGLREIQILFVAGQAVADDYRWMRAGSGRLIDDAIDEEAVSGDVDHGHLSGMRLVRWRIGVDRLGDGLGGSESSEDQERRGVVHKVSVGSVLTPFCGGGWTSESLRLIHRRG